MEMVCATVCGEKATVAASTLLCGLQNKAQLEHFISCLDKDVHLYLSIALYLKYKAFLATLLNSISSASG